MSFQSDAFKKSWNRDGGPMYKLPEYKDNYYNNREYIPDNPREYIAKPKKKKKSKPKHTHTSESNIDVARSAISDLTKVITYLNSHFAAHVQITGAGGSKKQAVEEAKHITEIAHHKAADIKKKAEHKAADEMRHAANVVKKAEIVAKRAASDARWKLMTVDEQEAVRQASYVTRAAKDAAKQAKRAAAQLARDEKEEADSLLGSTPGNTYYDQMKKQEAERKRMFEKLPALRDGKPDGTDPDQEHRYADIKRMGGVHGKFTVPSEYAIA